MALAMYTIHDPLNSWMITPLAMHSIMGEMDNVTECSQTATQNLALVMDL